LSPKISEAEVLEIVKKEENITKWLADKEIIKTIFVPGRLVNIVIKN